MSGRRRWLLLLLVHLLGVPIIGRAEVESPLKNLQSALQVLVEQDPRIKTAKLELGQAQQSVLASEGQWQPTLDISVTTGNHKNYTNRGQPYYSDSKVKLSQLLWDFGATNAAINKVVIQRSIKQLNLKRVRQGVTREALSVYIKLIQAQRTLQFSRMSEASIRKQTGLEQYRVAEGAGYSTDVLQSKAQLASAISRRTSNEGAVVIANNGYYALFGFYPPLFDMDGQPIAVLTLPDLLGFTAQALPTSLAQALNQSVEHNIDIKIERLRRELAKFDRRRSKAKNFYPEIKFTVERSFDRNQRSIEGDRHQLLAQVELRMPLGLSLSGWHKVKRSALLEQQKMLQVDMVVTETEKQVRNAWQNLKTAELRADFLAQQTHISAAFLALARKERSLGRRSLVDLLASEASLVNANSDLASAEADIVLAAITLLQSMGRLTVSVRI